MNLDKLVRPSVLKLKPYSSARDEYSGSAAVFLDANENPFNNPYNRYPDPHQRKLKNRIAKLFGIPADGIFLGNGSDEAIDLLIRGFCEPGLDEILSIDPTYGMYEVAAAINNVTFRKVSLQADFSVNVDGLLDAVTDHTKLLFLCSPNNPSSNSLDPEAIRIIIRGFNGLVILDEAYIDFSRAPSFLQSLNQFPNLVVLRTLSKAWGLAGIRLGMAFADARVIAVLDKIKYPYNINQLSQDLAFESLNTPEKKEEWVRVILNERSLLVAALEKISWVKKIFPSDANFLLVEVQNPGELYQYLVKESVIVRDRSSLELCRNCLRITVGNARENAELLRYMLNFTPS